MPDTAEYRLPAVGAAVPRRNYGFLKTLGRTALDKMGWRTEGELPDCPRLVVALAPHSSNWDFVIGALLVFALGLRVSFIGKHTLFKAPLGCFMKWLGGIPVDRARPDGLVEAMIEEFGKCERLWLGIAPEGTRSDGARFKSGFYRIAQATGVPILPVYFNYWRKIMGFLPLLQPGPDTAQGVDHVRRLLERHGARKPK
ncbi:MAG: lysophospholipid acyltransferase family protein [Burkholderiales bacterium]